MIFFMSLGWITNHGSYLQVPDVAGLETLQAIKNLEKDGFEVVISDSAYNPDQPLNTVKKQLPFAGATVKVNRRVLLQVNPKALPLVQMPDLKGMSYRFAVDNLKKYNLVAGDTTEKPDFMKGAVLEQMYKGKAISAGEKVQWGSTINLVIGGGVVAAQEPVPSLIGMTVAEVRELLNSKGILLASIIGSGEIFDTEKAYVYRQNPPMFDNEGTLSYIKPGQAMDIWIQEENPQSDSLQIPPQPEINNPASDY